MANMVQLRWVQIIECELQGKLPRISLDLLPQQTVESAILIASFEPPIKQHIVHIVNYGAV